MTAATFPSVARPFSRKQRPRRRWYEWLVILAALGVAAACTTAAAGLWWADRKANQLPRVAVGGTLDAIEVIGDDPLMLPARNFLLVGADSTASLPEDDPLRVGRSDAQLLTDTIMVLRIDPPRESVHLVSIPRDLWVRVAGGGYETKINALLSLGGSTTLIETLQETLGIPIHHYVEADFNGFRGVVDAVDGVPVYFPFPMRDAGTGFVQTEPGCATLDPDRSLAYVRSRRMEGLVDGLTWTTLDEVPDFGRITRQQGFIEAALERAIAKGGLRHPATSLQLLDAAIESVTLDDIISRRELIQLADQFQSFQARSLETATLPATFGFEGELSVLYVDQAEAEPILDPFRGEYGDAPESEPESTVGADDTSPGTFAPQTGQGSQVRLDAITLRVLNGTGAADGPADVTDWLKSLGAVIDRTVDQDVVAVPETTVRYRRGFEAEADLVATALGIDDLRANTALETPVQVTVGQDLVSFAPADNDADRPAPGREGQAAVEGTDAVDAAEGAESTELPTVPPAPETPSCV